VERLKEGKAPGVRQRQPERRQIHLQADHLQGPAALGAQLARTGERGHGVGGGAQAHIEQGEGGPWLAQALGQAGLLHIEAKGLLPGADAGVHHLAVPQVAHGPRAVAQRHQLEVTITRVHGVQGFSTTAPRCHNPLR
jgi:hypothetical protein